MGLPAHGILRTDSRLPHRFFERTLRITRAAPHALPHRCVCLSLVMRSLALQFTCFAFSRLRTHALHGSLAYLTCLVLPYVLRAASFRLVAPRCVHLCARLLARFGLNARRVGPPRTHKQTLRCYACTLPLVHSLSHGLPFHLVLTPWFTFAVSAHTTAFRAYHAAVHAGFFHRTFS